MKPGEIIESVSLGAGNTGRQFDLETNLRIAEYKFIDWRGDSESIRQNGVFKDFFSMAEYETSKTKHLYVVGITHPIRFLTGGRAGSRNLEARKSGLLGVRAPGASGWEADAALRVIGVVESAGISTCAWPTPRGAGDLAFVHGSCGCFVLLRN